MEEKRKRSWVWWMDVWCEGRKVGKGKDDCGKARQGRAGHRAMHILSRSRWTLHGCPHGCECEWPLIFHQQSTHNSYRTGRPNRLDTSHFFIIMNIHPISSHHVSPLLLLL